MFHILKEENELNLSIKKESWCIDQGPKQDPVLRSLSYWRVVFRSMTMPFATSLFQGVEAKAFPHWTE